MNKYCSTKKADFAYLKEDGSRKVIGYGMTETEAGMVEWYEVALPHRQYPMVGFVEVKSAIIGDINRRIDEKILNGFVWNGIKVWLSAENQRNFSEAQRMAEKYGESVLPLTFKLGEDEDGAPVYHTFESTEDLDDFYTKAFAYVNQTLAAGWKEKDSIDWTPYEEMFPKQEMDKQS